MADANKQATTRFVLSNVRLSFPHLWKKAQFKGKDTKYEATVLIPKSDEEQINLIKRKIQQKLLAEFKTKDEIPNAIKAEGKTCFRDGDLSDYDGYADHMSFKAANDMHPSIRQRNKEVATEDMNLLYAGCYVDVVVDVWIQNNEYGKRVNANLYGIRFREDGDAFSAGRIPDGVEDDFDDLPDDDQEMDVDDF